MLLKVYNKGCTRVRKAKEKINFDSKDVAKLEDVFAIKGKH